MDTQTDALLKSLSGIYREEKVLYRTEDAWGEITVGGYRQFRILRFDDLFEQSKVNLRSPQVPVHQYTWAMLMAACWCEPSSALVLGLGGGGLVRALHAMDCAMPVDVVELRPAVIRIAREWFTLPETDAIRYFPEDAVSFLARETGRRYPLVFADLYLAWEMDPIQGIEAFLAHCRAQLCDGGWLVINYLTIPARDSKLYQALYRVFSEVLFCVTTGGNVVIYATCRGRNIEELRQRVALKYNDDAHVRILIKRLDRL
ncbi:spermidine synthase [[Enterobacter] lignolyticus]|uniref:Spermidine synthase-like protein n=1 Tax=Enterobacter lignolyticus (strain SCF1) TaxID=701347 RepID=E3GD46_ENTLS|nr:spermidine synthase [[Enterobacter] lignolyticus]ADO49065.1 spermidine synthase-like protein [[Enterobacter] lignolyticus SCF1]